MLELRPTGYWRVDYGQITKCFKSREAAERFAATVNSHAYPEMGRGLVAA